MCTHTVSQPKTFLPTCCGQQSLKRVKTAGKRFVGVFETITTYKSGQSELVWLLALIKALRSLPGDLWAKQRASEASTSRHQQSLLPDPLVSPPEDTAISPPIGLMHRNHWEGRGDAPAWGPLAGATETRQFSAGQHCGPLSAGPWAEAFTGPSGHRLLFPG